MLPAVKEKHQLVINRRLKLLENPIVSRELNATDKVVAQASLKNPIKLMDDSDLLSKVEVLIPFICKDIGLSREVEVYEITRFIDLIKKYYSDLTLSEIKIAFEFSLIEELDNYLPKDKSGLPDKNHYQNFSMDYVTKILNAYKKRKSETWAKAWKALPAPKNTITEEEKEKNHAYFINSIVEKFDIYKATGLKPEFTIPFLVLENLKKAGLVTEEIEVTDEDRKVALNRILSVGIYSKFNLAIIKSEGINSPVVEISARTLSMDRMIVEIFDKLISENEELKHYLCKL